MKFPAAEKIKKYRTEGSSEALLELIEAFRPLIHKYARKFGVNEEDAAQELTLALLESVKKMKYANDDGACINYIVTAVKNRFFSLMGRVAVERECLDAAEMPDMGMEMDEIRESEYRLWIRQCAWNMEDKKRRMIEDIFIENSSVSDTAKRYGVSRQYVTRVKQQFVEVLKKVVYK